MAKAKKTKKEKVEEVPQELNSIPEIQLRQNRIEQCEWCFQFDDDEPQVFAWTDENLPVNEEPAVTFTVTNIENSYVSFSHSGKSFKIFARELSETGKSKREKQREAFKNLENGSENKEA